MLRCIEGLNSYTETRVYKNSLILAGLNNLRNLLVLAVGGWKLRICLNHKLTLSLIGEGLRIGKGLCILSTRS